MKTLDILGESETMKIELVGDQQKKLIGFMDELRAMAKIGKPGVCIARVWDDEMKVKVLSHEQALAVEKLFHSFVTPGLLTKLKEPAGG